MDIRSFRWPIFTISCSVILGSLAFMGFSTTIHVATALVDPTSTPGNPVQIFVYQQKWGGDVFVGFSDGRPAINLTEKLLGSKTFGHYDSVSPDKQWVIVGRFDGTSLGYGSTVSASTKTDIWLFKTDGTVQKELFRGTPSSATQPFWAPNSHYVVVWCPLGENPLGLCIVQVGGTEIKLWRTGYAGFPSISHNSRYLIWQSSAPVRCYLLMDVETRATRRLPCLPAATLTSNEVWASDNQSVDVLHASLTRPIVTLYTIRLTGVVVKRTEFQVFYKGDDLELVQSPDKSRLAFWIRLKGNLYFSIMVINFDGTGQILIDMKDYDFVPGQVVLEWSDDGQTLILISTNRETRERETYEIDLKTREVRKK
jgi:hypothetical protein